MDDYEGRIRNRAYRIWEEQGHPEGRADAHWDMASELIAIEDNHALALKPVNPELGLNGEPIEPIEALENAGEFPTLTDQGEASNPHRRQQ